MITRFSNMVSIRLAAHIVLLASLVLAAFAHTVHQPATPGGMDERAYAAQYRLPDGTLPIICNKSGNGRTHHPFAAPCEFCSLADNTALTPPFSEKRIDINNFGLENRLTSKGLVFAKALHGLHGASRAPPRIWT